MAWIPIGDDLISELVADDAHEALDDLRDARVRRHGRAPSVEELLAAVAGALREAGVDADGEPRARLVGGDERRPGDSPADPDAVARLTRLFGEAAAPYRDALDRDPRASELLETLAFAIGPELPRYVDEPDLQLDELYLAPR